MSRVGIIKEVKQAEKVVELIGYGEFVGNIMVENEDIGMEVEVPQIQLDNGTVYNNVDGFYWADESLVEADVKEYELKGFSVNIVDS